MFERGVAIIYVTPKGSEVAHRVASVLKHHGIKYTIFAPERYAQEGESPLRTSLSKEIEEIFDRFDAIVGIMASGILIRVLAPLLRSKLIDPAVICIDIAGRFAVSLISGHYGGANHLTRLIAAGIGAIPVITTGSDVIGKKSVEEIAKDLHCKILNPDRLVNINASIVNGRKVALLFVGFDAFKVPSSIYGYEVIAVKNLEEVNSILDKFDCGILILRNLSNVQMNFIKPVILLRPKKIIIGIGARRDVNLMEILEAIERSLNIINIPLAFVQALATVDIKRESKNIVSVGQLLGIPIHFISMDEIRKFTYEDLSDSEIVKKHIGVGGICERAALIAAGRDARLIMRKMKFGRITIAVAEAE